MGVMNWSKTAVAVAVALSLGLGGCVSNSGSSGSTGADPRLANDDFNVDESSYAVACGVGALAVGGLCLLIADSNNRAACIAAAGAGCLAGMGGNALLDNLRKDYHTEEQQLDALAATMESNNAKARSMASAAKSVYADDQAKLKNLEKQIKNGQAQKSDLQATIAQYDANIKLLQENIDSHTKSLDSYKTARNGIAKQGQLNDIERKKLKECDARIADLEKSIESIRTVLASYTESRNSLNLQVEKMA